MYLLIPIGLSPQVGPLGWGGHSDQGFSPFARQAPCEHLCGLMLWTERLGSDLTETLAFPSGRPQTVPEDFQEQG